MKKFICKIELSEPFGSPSIGEFEVGGDLRGAIEWLILAGHRDSCVERAGTCVGVEHDQKDLIIRIDRRMAAEAAIGRRIS